MQSDKVASATLTFDDLIDESYLEVPAGADAAAQVARGAAQSAAESSHKVTAFPAKPESPRPTS